MSVQRKYALATHAQFKNYTKNQQMKKYYRMLDCRAGRCLQPLAGAQVVRSFGAEYPKETP